jgi:hypothetical protein
MGIYLSWLQRALAKADQRKDAALAKARQAVANAEMVTTVEQLRPISKLIMTALQETQKATASAHKMLLYQRQKLQEMVPLTQRIEAQSTAILAPSKSEQALIPARLVHTTNEMVDAFARYISQAMADAESNRGKSLQALQAVSTQSDVVPVRADLVQAMLALDVMAGVQEKIVQLAQLARTERIKALSGIQQVQAAVKARQDYLAQFGGVDPELILQQVQAGNYPAVPAGIVLKGTEIALYSMPAALAEDRTTSRTVGGSVGYSVPLGHGFRFRVGSYQGQTIREERLTTVDQGSVVVTTQRVVFNGRRRSLAIPTNKILNTVVYRDGLDVRAENRVKREVFLCQNPLLLNTYVLVAGQLAQTK